MTEIYIVIQCGYEGIENLGRGFTDKDKAIAQINLERSKYDNPDKDDIEMSYYFYQLDELNHTKEQMKKWVEGEKRRWCIQRDSGDGFSCVCKELGVSISDEMWLY